MDKVLMEQISVVLFWFALVLYVGATVLYAYQFLLRKPVAAWWARFFTGAGFLAQTISIGANSVAQGGTPLTGPNQLMLAAWALVLLYFVIEHLIKLKVYGAFLIPIAVVLMIASRFLGPAGVQPPAPNPLLDSWRVGVHVALIIFANAGFAFGAISSALYLYQGTRLKKHKTNLITRRLPSLATLQTIARRAIGLSFPVYTIGLVLGIIRALETDISGWWADPRIMLSGLVWLVFGFYLLAVYRRGVSGKTASWIAIGGLFLVIVLAVLARTVPVGFHVFGLPPRE
ncbi:MAG: cytochrome c biogenesis protein CcsA [Coriobacteriales bacterium]|nr:cytochrome c biogenesis protein CcsA [Coriobacteriales bacterium]